MADNKQGGFGGARGLGMPVLGGLAMPGLASSQSNPVTLPSFVIPTGHMVAPVKKPVFRNVPFARQLPEEGFRALSITPKVKPRLLPPFYEKNMSFSCDRPAEEIYDAIAAALRDHTVESKPDKGKYKGHAEIMGQCISFQIHLFLKPDGGHLVEFQRRRGDSCAFWHFFRETMEALGKDLADAASFVKGLPEKSHVQKRPSLEVTKATKLSGKTLKTMRDLASTSGSLQLGILQTMNNLAESLSKDDSDAISTFRTVAATACISRDPLVSRCARSVLEKMPKAAPKEPSLVTVDDIYQALAQNTLRSIKSEKEDFSKANGKVADIGSREPTNVLGL